MTNDLSQANRSGTEEKKMSSPIPAQRYDFPEEDVGLILDQIGALIRTRGFLTLGEYGTRFERAFAQHTGRKHAIAVNSGTAALEIILRAIDVRDAEVIVPTNTFAATAFAVLHAGGKVVFADCGADLTIDPDDVERRISPTTKAVVVVHIGGLISPSVERLRDLCESKGLVLVEDAAHAHGSRLNGKHPGSFGRAAALSFFSTKVMTTGEGGLILTDDDDLAAVAQLVRDQAKVAGANLHETVGYNWRMAEFQAILGVAQLARLNTFVAERRRVAQTYDRMLTGVTSTVHPLSIPAGAEPNFYKYIVFIDSPKPEQVATRLKQDYAINLGGAVYDVPCHLQPVFAGMRNGALPVSERLCSTHICPPIYPSLTDGEAERVANAIIEVCT